MRRNRGITLIALVITIIVLLILAGVSISAVIGENGIATKAKESSKKTEIEKVKESISLDISAAQIENEGSITETEVNAILAEYGTVAEEDEKIILITNKNLEIDITEIIQSLSIEEENLENTVPLIEFKIGNVTCYAEEDMTWGEWVADTKYNTIGAIISKNLGGDSCVFVPTTIEGVSVDCGMYDEGFDIEHEEGYCALNVGMNIWEGESMKSIIVDGGNDEFIYLSCTEL